MIAFLFPVDMIESIFISLTETYFIRLLSVYGRDIISASVLLACSDSVSRFVCSTVISNGISSTSVLRNNVSITDSSF